MRLTSRTDDRGFTLLELAAVTLILGILVGISIASYTVAVNRTQRITCASQLRILNGAVAQYQSTHDGARPSSIIELGPFLANDVDSHNMRYDTCPENTAIFYTYDDVSGIKCPTHTAP